MNMNNLKSKVTLSAILSPNSKGYATMTLVLSFMSCIGTWVAPQVIPSLFQSIFAAPLPMTAPANGTISVQESGLYSAVDAIWIFLFVIGSVSMWTFAIMSIRLLNVLFAVNAWPRLSSRKTVLRTVSILVVVYAFVGFIFRFPRFTPLHSVITALAYQAGGLVMLAAFGFIVSPMAYLALVPKQERGLPPPFFERVIVTMSVFGIAGAAISLIMALEYFRNGG